MGEILREIEFSVKVDTNKRSIAKKFTSLYDLLEFLLKLDINSNLYSKEEIEETLNEVFEDINS